MSVEFCSSCSTKVDTDNEGEYVKDNLYCEGCFEDLFPEPENP